MKLNIVINDYMLIWTLLFQVPVKESISKMRKKLWNNYKLEFTNVYKDKTNVIKDPKNFIPNDDIIYNLIKENEDYEDLKREIEKYRCKIMKQWDSNIKKINRFFEDIVRMNIQDYNILVVHENQNIIDVSVNDSDIKTIVLGKKLDEDNPNNIIIKLIINILNKEIKKTTIQNEDIRRAIIELAVYNELATRLTSKSHYISGTLELDKLKRNLYPYWLMYMNIPKHDFNKFMSRDNISFDPKKYAYEKEFSKMSLEEFIEFCIRNKRAMLKNNIVEIEEII